jgi:hypothetical protein
MRRRAFEKQKRREEAQLVALRSDVRTLMGDEPIEHPYSSSPKAEQQTDTGEAARIAALREMDIEGEEMTPADAASEFTE